MMTNPQPNTHEDEFDEDLADGLEAALDAEYAPEDGDEVDFEPDGHDGPAHHEAGRVTPSTTHEQARQFAIQAANLAAEYKIENIVVLDLRGLSSLTDFFVIGTGTSSRQMHATLERLREIARNEDRRPYRTSEPTDASWMLADYVDVVVHLFDEQHRSYYDLDSLWGDAPLVDWAPEEDDADD